MVESHSHVGPPDDMFRRTLQQKNLGRWEESLIRPDVLGDRRVGGAHPGEKNDEPRLKRVGFGVGRVFRAVKTDPFRQFRHRVRGPCFGLEGASAGDSRDGRHVDFVLAGPIESVGEFNRWYNLDEASEEALRRCDSGSDSAQADRGEITRDNIPPPASGKRDSSTSGPGRSNCLEKVEMAVLRLQFIGARSAVSVVGVRLRGHGEVISTTGRTAG